MRNPFKKSKPSAEAIADTTRLGTDLTALFVKSCTDYLEQCNKERTDGSEKIQTIPITVLELFVKTYIIADQKNVGKLKSKNEKQAFARIAAWKSEIVKQIYASGQAYTKRYGTNQVPLHIIEGIVKLIDIKTKS